MGRKWLSKASRVELTGKIKTGHYTSQKEYREIYYTEVVANSLSFERQKQRQRQGSRAAASSKVATTDL